MYTEDLKDPIAVSDNYIKSLVNGDTNFSMYYVAGNWKEIKDLGIFCDLLEGKSKMKAKKRLIEHYSWNIEKLETKGDKLRLNISIKSPDGRYFIKRRSELMGDHYDGDTYVSGTAMTESEAINVIRHEKNLPLQTDKFTIQMKKNQYGWVIDYLDKGTQELSTFLNDS